MALTCTTFFCRRCRKETKFLPIHFAVAATGVSRASFYRWMERRFIHYRELPTGHRMLCLDSIRKVAAIDLRLLATLVKNSQPGGSTKRIKPSV
ncbi:MAG: hypothetical protein DMG31_10235 [Acidobacteria bacterium]|nr:MAG: hypothetical protein DMG31_10235 [Acidobacteriota bacterium]